MMSMYTDSTIADAGVNINGLKVHFKAIESDEKTLKEGQIVSFVAGVGSNGIQAGQVRRE